jgi:hypothetical protein
VRDAFGVERPDVVSKFNPLKPFKALRRVSRAAGRGPGAQLTPGAVVGRSPARPAGNFVHADEDAIKTFVTQRRRQATKNSFIGKRDSKDPKPLHPLAVGAATAGGALAGQSAYMSVTPFNNHVMKPYFSRKMEEAGPDSEQARIWREWNKPREPRVRAKHAKSGPKVDPGFRGGEKNENPRPFNRRAAEKEAQSNTKRAAWHGSKEFHRKFPKGLPGWRTHRALSYAGKGLSGHATAAAAMTLGGLASYKIATHASKKTEVKKWGYVPKSAMTPKLLLQDPGFLAPVAGVTTLGVGGAALASRKYRKRKKK